MTNIPKPASLQDMETTTFSKGDGATMCMWSDRHAGTIIDVTPNGKTVVWQEDNAVRTDDNGLSESQSYDYSPNPNGRVRTFTLRKNGRWVQKGETLHGGTRLSPGRREYRDPSF